MSDLTIEELEARIVAAEAAYTKLQQEFFEAQQRLHAEWGPLKEMKEELANRKVKQMEESGVIDWAMLIQYAPGEPWYRPLNNRVRELFPEGYVNQSGCNSDTEQYQFQLRLDGTSRDKLDSINDRLQPILAALKPITYQRVDMQDDAAEAYGYGYQDITGKFIDILEPSLSQYGSWFLVGDEGEWNLLFRTHGRAKRKATFQTFRQFLDFAQVQFSDWEYENN